MMLLEWNEKLDGEDDFMSFSLRCNLGVSG